MALYPGAASIKVKDGPFTDDHEGCPEQRMGQVWALRVVDHGEHGTPLAFGHARARVRQPRFHCRFQWRKNALAFWDNRCTQHMAIRDYYPRTRSGHRFTIAGDRPV